MKRRILPAILVIVGSALLLASILSALDNATASEPVGLGKWLFDVLGTLLGAGAGIKGWLDLRQKKDAPSGSETRLTAFDGGQVSTGAGGKNIQAGIYIEKAEFPGAVLPTAVPAVQNRLHQLPPPPRDFVERAKELDELRQAFHNGRAAALCGLTGMGGVGKTTLGLAFARALAQDYPDAQLFLDLKGTAREPEQPLAPAEAMRYVIHAFEPEADLRALSEAELAAFYCNCLDGKKALLFLDNARSAEQVKPLLPPPSCAVLITSRWRFPLPGLKAVDVGVMKADEAETFLLELCPRVGAHAAALAKACGYLPLALRIAGSFLAVNADWTLPEYLDRLQSRRLATLASAEDAERDLETVFAESYENLSEDERQKWRALAVFPASFGRPAAAAVWDLDESAAHDLLSRLCRYSLLDFLPPSPPSPLPLGEGGGGEGRYSLHDLLRDFAISRLAEGEMEAAALRHAEHYHQVLSRADDLYLQGDENILAGLALFDREAEHIKAGQAWAAAHSPELCSAYPHAGAYVLDLRLTPKEKIAWLEAALQAARRLHNRAGEGVHLGNLGNAYAALGDARQAIEFYEQALAIDREIGDRRGEGADLGNLGLAYAALGDARQAIEFYEKQLVIVREIGDRRGEGNALFNMAIALHGLGEKKRAIELMKQALAIFETIESPYANWARNKLKQWGVK